jgi:2-polyprenyl-3-methyl-5-hydroxy-6-metoxy-1,4-benzoquinol methylase
MDFSVRSRLPEVMDDPGLESTTYQRCLADLAALNRLTLTHRPVLRWLAKATRRLPPGAGFSVLDVACGHGDLLRAIAAWAARRGLDAALSGIDLNPRSAIAARAVTPAGMQIDYLTGDVFDYAPAQKPDFIVTSQFTHHLDDAEIVRLLQWFEKNAGLGWYITDLHRHAIAYYGFPLLTVLAGWHPIVRHDGMVSIARSFRKADWQNLLSQAGTPAEISWQLPFRHGVSRLVEHGVSRLVEHGVSRLFEHGVARLK